MELTTNGRHANYEMKLSGFDLDTSTNKVYGVVLTAADGSEYGLHHVTNIWRGTELGFNTDEPYLASIIGKTVTQITYYTADGVYVLPVSVALQSRGQLPDLAKYSTKRQGFLIAGNLAVL